MRTSKPQRELTPMEQAMKPALEALIVALRQLDGSAEAKYSVHLWEPSPDELWKVGVRVAEVSVLMPDGSGGAWMQGDIDCAPLIYACERFLITFGQEPFTPEGFETSIDFHAEAREALTLAWQ